MNRNFLKGLGLEDDIINKILDEVHKDNAKFKTDNESLNERLNALQANNTKTIEDFTKKIKELEESQKAKDKEHLAELNKVKIDSIIDNSLLKAGAKNNKAVKALLENIDKFTIDEKGNIEDLESQLKALKESEETSFLFNTNESTEEKPSFKGTVPTDDGKAEKTTIDLKGASYEQLCEHFSNNNNA